MFARRPRAHARWCVAHLAFCVLLISLVPSRATAFATSRADDQQHAWLPVAPLEEFAGEITYKFDSVLNTTTAAYVAPLRSDDLLHRILFLTPTVHTIKATYQFEGRTASHVPDSIRVVLLSDEVVESPSERDFLFSENREISIKSGRSAVHHGLSMSLRIDLDSNTRVFSNQISLPPDKRDPRRLPPVVRAHITRRSAAWFPICEFLSLIEQPTVEGTVAGLDFTLNHKVVTGLKLFAAEMLPDVVQDRSVACTSK